MSEAHTIPTVITAPRLLARRRHFRCPSCGERGHLPNLLSTFLLGNPDRQFKIGFCPGGKEPTGEAFVPTLMGPQKIEGHFPCAGIQQAHLHYTCRVCDYHFMVETVGKPVS
jgi:hypothetical protein